MLHGFEDVTYELTDYEKDTLLPALVKGLSVRVGRGKAVTNKQIVQGMVLRGYKITDVRVRKIINHIRNNNLLAGLIASSKGYYISTDPAEIGNYITSLKGRENAIAGVRKNMTTYLNKIQ